MIQSTLISMAQWNSASTSQRPPLRFFHLLPFHESDGVHLYYHGVFWRWAHACSRLVIAIRIEVCSAALSLNLVVTLGSFGLHCRLCSLVHCSGTHLYASAFT